MQRGLKLKSDIKNWRLYGKTEPRTSGVFYCLRLYRKDNGNGAWAELNSNTGGLKFNPITGGFSASIPSQVMASASGIYLYELTEMANGNPTLLQKGELNIAEPKKKTIVKTTIATQPDTSGGDTIGGATGGDEDFDLKAYYDLARNSFLGVPDTPSPLDN